jgi:hypothetical protein
MRNGRRWLYLSIVVLTLVQCGWWAFSGWFMWYLRGFMLEPSSPQIAENMRFAVAMLVVAAINIGVLFCFLARPQTWGRLLLAAVLIGNIAFCSWASLSRENIGWLLLGGVPAVITLTLVVLFRPRASEISPVRS